MFVWILKGKQLCLFSIFFFGKKKLREKEEMLEREGKTETLFFITIWNAVFKSSFYGYNC